MSFVFRHGTCAEHLKNPAFLPCDCRIDRFHVEFDRRSKVELHGSTVTSDAGLLAYRELDFGVRLAAVAE